MVSESEFKRVYWASRRGMLELDLIMVPYVEQRFKSLSEADQRHFCRLLDSQDTELYAWFLQREHPADPDLVRIVDDVLAFTRGI